MKKQNDTTTKGELLQDKWEVHYDLDGSTFIYSGEKCIAMIQSEEEKATPEDDARAELICQAVNERQKLLDSRAELLKQAYHAIDIRCFSETENVSMTAIREELVKLGANEKELW